MAMARATVVYDTHAAVRRLTEAGLPEPQAVVREQTLLLEHNLATKTDIKTLRQETQAGIETLRQETRAGIEASKNSLVIWVVGLNAGLVGLTIAILKLL